MRAVTLALLVILLLGLAGSARAATTFTTQPTKSAATATTVTVTFKVTSDVVTTVRCGAVTKGTGTPEVWHILNDDHPSKQGTAATHITVQSGTDQTLTVTGLTAATAYDFYCATATPQVLSSKVEITTSNAFTAQPAKKTYTSTTVTLSFTAVGSGNARCGAVTTGTTGVTAANILNGDNAAKQGTPANKDTFTTATPKDLAITALTSGTTYDFYCMLETDSVLSDKVTIKLPTAKEFTVQPTKSAHTDTTVTLTFTAQSDAADNVACTAVTKGTNPAPTAAEVIANNHASKAGTNAGKATLTPGVTQTFATTGLTAATEYDFYCALETATTVSSKVTTQTAAVFATQPSKSAVTTTTVTLTFKGTAEPTVTNNVRCGAITKGTVPTGTNVLNSDHASKQGTAPAKVALTSGVDQTFAISGLTAGTEYDFYCAIEASGATLSTKVTIATESAFTVAPSQKSAISTAVTLTFTANHNGGNVRCAAIQGDAAAPSVAEVIGDSNANKKGTADAKAVASGSTQSLAVTGLTASTKYDFYCALESSTVITSKLTITTPAIQPFLVQPDKTAYTSTSVTLTFTSEAAAGTDARCGAVLKGTTTDATKVIAGTDTKGTADPKVTATSAVAQTLKITGLTANTEYDFYCAVGTTLSNAKTIKTLSASEFTVQPAKSAATETTVTLSFTVNLADATTTQVRCAAVTKDTTSSSVTVWHILNDDHDSKQGSAAVAINVVTGTSQTLAITGLAASTSYDFYCALNTPQTLSSKVTASTSDGFSVQPTRSSGTSTTVTLSFTARVASTNVRCGAVTKDTAGVTALNILNNDNAAKQGTPADKASVTSGTTQTFVITGLAASTAYDFYCALESPSTLSTKLAISTYAKGVFTAGPTQTTLTATSVTVSFTTNVDATENVRCGALDTGATSVTALSIVNENHGKKTGTYATSIPTTTGAAQTLSITGLTAATSYDVYCGLETTRTISNKLTVTTDAGFTVAPKVTTVTTTTATLTFTARVNSATTVRCGAFTTGVTGVTAAYIFHQDHDNKQGTADAAANVNSGNSQTLAISGLVPGTSYDFYCALFSPATIVSDKVSAATTSGFSVAPAEYSKTSTSVTLSFTATVATATNVRCGAVTKGTPGVTAANILGHDNAAKQGSPASKVPVTSGVTQTLAISGLTADTTYDFYCTLESPTTLSTALQLATRKNFQFLAAPSKSSSTSTTITLAFTAYAVNATNVRCGAVSAGATSVSAANILEDSHGSKKGTAAAKVAVTSNTAQTLVITGLTASTSYDFYCALENPATLSDKATLSTPSVAQFTIQPTKSAATATSVTLSFTANVDVATNVRCGAFTSGVTPTVANILNADHASRHGTPSGKASVNSGVSNTFAITGLTAGTIYDFFCALEEPSTLSSKATVNTLNAFTVQPTQKAYTSTTITVSFTARDTSAQVRCAAFTKDAVGVTIATVINSYHLSHQGTALAKAAATNNPQDLSISALTKETTYDVYCAIEGVALSNKLSITTPNTGLFTVQPTKSSFKSTEVTLTVTANLDAATNVRCAALTKDATFVTPLSILNDNHGQRHGTAPAKAAINHNSATTFGITGLTKETAYDFYCVLESPLTRSNVYQLTTPVTSLFVVQPKVSSSTSTKVTLTFTANSDTSTTARCSALKSSSAAPTAAAVIADNDANKVGTADAAITVSGNAQTIAISGLTASTSYDIYCAINSGPILSEKVVVQTPNAGGFSVQPKESTVTSNSVTLTFTAYADADTNVRCVAVTKDSKDVTAAQVIANSHEGKQGTPAPAVKITSAAAQSLEITSLKGATAYDFYCALESPATLSEKVSVTLSTYVFSVQPTNSGVTSSSVSISFTASGASDTARCIALTSGAATPNVTAVIDALGQQGNADAALTTTGQSQTVAITGLSSKKSYDVYCALKQSNVVSTKTSFTTPSVTFGTQPAKTAVTATTATVTFRTSSAGDDVRCAAFTAGSAPTVTNIIGATGTGFVGSAPKAAATGLEQTAVITTLLGSVTYDVYCALENSATQSDKVSITTDKAALSFSGALTSSGITSRYITIGFKASGLGDSARCIALPANAPAPTGSGVIAGTNGNGTAAGKVTVNGEDQKLSITGLLPSTTYDFYCGLESSNVTSAKLTAALPADVTFATQPQKSFVRATSATLTFKTSATADFVRCAAVSSGTPTAQQIIAGSAPNNVGTPGNLTDATAQDQTFVITGLTGGVNYTYFCALQVANTVSNSTNFATFAPLSFAAEPSKNVTTYNSITVGFRISATGDNVRCVAVTKGSAQPTVSQVIAGTATGLQGTAAAAKATSAQADTLLLSGLLPNTEYDVYCALENSEVLKSAALATDKLAFSAQPSSSSVKPSSITVSFTASGSGDNVRCLAVTVNSAAPTAVEVLNATHAQKQGDADAKAAATGNPQTLSISSLAAATTYDVYCAFERSAVVSNKTSLATAAALTFASQPAQSSVTSSVATLKFTASANTDNVRCIALAANATAPTHTVVIAGTGSQGTPAAKVATTASEQTFTISGLPANTTYDVYCAFEAGGVSQKAVLKTLAPLTFTTQPSKESVTSSTLTVTFAASGATDFVRCTALTSGTPSVAEVFANSNANAKGLPAAKATATGANQTFAIAGLTSGATYSVYCAFEGGGLSTAATFATSGPLTFTSAPASQSARSSSVTLAFTASGTTDYVRCGAVAKDATAPSVAQVFANSHGSRQGNPAEKVLASGTNQTFAIGGLAAATTYDFYCAFEGGASVSGKVTQATTSALTFTTQPTSTSSITSLTLSFKASGATDDVRCTALAPEATPTVAQVIANSHANAKGTPAAATSTTGETQSLVITGLSVSSTYTVYCALEGSGVLSNKVTGTTSAALSFSSQPAKTATTSSSLTVTFQVSGADDNVRCGAVAANATAPSVADLISGTGLKGTAAAKAATTGSNQTFAITALNASTTFDVYCGLEFSSVLSTKVAVTTDADAPALSGVTVVASPLTAGSSATFAVSFTQSTTGLAVNNTITVTLPGYSLSTGAIAIEKTAGFDTNVTLTGAVTSATTIVVTLGGSGGLSAGTAGAFRFTATHPSTAQNVTATLATSVVPTAVASSTVISLVAPSLALAFSVEPATVVTVGKTFPVAPEVQLWSGGARDTNGTATVTLALGGASANVTLKGTLSLATSGGVAKFTGLSIETNGTYYLVATATGGYGSATSRSFAAQAAVTATALRVLSQPLTSLQAGTRFGIVVAAQDASNNTNPDQTGTVSLTTSALADRTKLKGFLQQGFIAGVASFSGLWFSAAGSYQLTASALGLSSVSTSTLVITAATTPTSVLFSQQPSVEASAVVFTSQPVVRILAADGNDLSTATGSVLLTLNKIASIPVSILSGTTVLAATSGVATFKDIKATGADTSLYLTATYGVLSGSSFGTFSVVADAATATNQRSQVQTQSIEFSVTFDIVCPVGVDCHAGIKQDICDALALSTSACARVVVGFPKAQSARFAPLAAYTVLVTFLNSADPTAPNPSQLFSAVQAQYNSPSSPLRQGSFFSHATSTTITSAPSNLRASSATTVVASATVVAAGVLAALLL